MNFLEKLDYMMNKLSINKRKLSIISGVPYTTIDAFYKKGYENTKISTIRKIASALNVSLDYLVDDNISDEGYQPPSTKKAPSDLSEEAHKIAKSYEKLTDHGKGAVKAILGYEEKELSHYSQREDEDGKVITMPKSRRSGPMVQIRVYEQPAAAGLGNYLDEPDFHVEQYPPSVIPAQTDFGVVISGDSMEPKVHDGGTVFVQAAPSIEPGKIGIFVLNGQAYCKKLVVEQESRTVRLVSLNPKYGDIVVDEDSDAFRTLGRVLGQWTPGHKQDLFGW